MNHRRNKIAAKVIHSGICLDLAVLIRDFVLRENKWQLCPGCSLLLLFLHDWRNNRIAGEDLFFISCVPYPFLASISLCYSLSSQSLCHPLFYNITMPSFILKITMLWLCYTVTMPSVSNSITMLWEWSVPKLLQNFAAPPRRREWRDANWAFISWRQTGGSFAATRRNPSQIQPQPRTTHALMKSHEENQTSRKGRKTIAKVLRIDGLLVNQSIDDRQGSICGKTFEIDSVRVFLCRAIR